MLLACLTVACGGAGEPTPYETIDRYFRSLARDPIRSLEILTPEFHRGHGLRFELVRDDPVIDALVEITPGSRAWGDTALGAIDPELERQRAMLGWLTALTKRAFALRGPIATSRISERSEGDRAEAVVRAELDGAAPFDVHFSLVRDPGGAWRIDAIEIPDEARLHAAAVFLVAPTAARAAALDAWLKESRERR